MAGFTSGLWILVMASALQTAESKLPEQDFRSPLDLPMDLSGNFGQLRSTHFHAGLDIRTKQSVGHKVYAVGDGYVSKIRVNIYGYGKVVYISHPNGKTTVYAHLDQFGTTLQERIEAEWQKTRKYEVEINPKAWEIPVKKGDIIGLSGNTGGSGGPHLHFEIRDTETGETLNPLKNGYAIADSKKPVFTGLRLYSLDENGRVNGEKSQSDILLTGSESLYKPKSANAITVSGTIGIGINAHDPVDLNSFRMGLYKLNLYVNDSLIYGYTHDRLSFPEGKRIVLHCDYDEKIAGNNAIEKLWVLPGNDSRLYDKGPGSGMFYVREGKTYRMRIEAEDANGNRSKLEFNLQGTATAPGSPKPKPAGKVFSFLQDWADSLTGKNFSLTLPENSLFEDLDVSAYEQSNVKAPELLSWQIGHAKQFLKKDAVIRLNAAVLPAAFLPKLYVLHEGKRIVPSERNDNSFSIRYMRLGRFSLALDTLAPSISGPELSTEGGLKKYEGILRLKTSDSQTGILNWEAELNGEFLMLEYEYKENLLFARKPKLLPGTNTLKVKLSDGVGNETELSLSFVY